MLNLVIVCEGEKTEKIYFQNYKERKSGLKIHFPKSKYTDPKGLVEDALRQIKKLDLDLESGDQIWCVFDVDNHKNPKIKNAEEKAGEKIKICLSNPSFEMWYLLHFKYSHAKILNGELKQELKNYLNGYAKNQDYFDKLLKHRPKAIKNAKKLEQVHKRDHIEILSRESNPSTQVFSLVEHILETIEKNKSRANSKSR